MNYQRAREVMVRHQIKDRGLSDPRLLDALREVPREEFVPERYRDLSAADTALPIGEDQTISQPYVVALMTDALNLEPGHKILEVGTGSGYQAALLAEMGARVYTIERLDSLRRRAERTLHRLGYDDVHLRTDDGTLGWPEEAPFHGILVTAAGPTIPNNLLDQLHVGGHLIFPLAVNRHQTLTRITREPDGLFTRRDIARVAFVPLIGAEGYHPPP